MDNNIVQEIEEISRNLGLTNDNSTPSPVMTMTDEAFKANADRLEHLQKRYMEQTMNMANAPSVTPAKNLATTPNNVPKATSHRSPEEDIQRRKLEVQAKLRSKGKLPTPNVTLTSPGQAQKTTPCAQRAQRQAQSHGRHTHNVKQHTEIQRKMQARYLLPSPEGVA